VDELRKVHLELEQSLIRLRAEKESESSQLKQTQSELADSNEKLAEVSKQLELQQQQHIDDMGMVHSAVSRIAKSM